MVYSTHGQINQFSGFVKYRSKSWDGREIDVRGEGAKMNEES